MLAFCYLLLQLWVKFQHLPRFCIFYFCFCWVQEWQEMIQWSAFRKTVLDVFPMVIVAWIVCKDGNNMLNFTTSLSVCIYLRYCLAFIVECLRLQHQQNIFQQIPEWDQNMNLHSFWFPSLIVRFACAQILFG
jgi:hypothetical protein